MTDEKNIKAAKAVYADICAMLDGRKWSYNRRESEWLIQTSARGDDLAIDIRIKVDVERQLVILYSPMPFVVPETMRREMAVAVACANRGMVDGSFDYKYETGKILFRLVASYRNSLISKEVYDYVLSVSCSTVDDYNDKFFSAINRKMSIEEIRNYIK